MLLLGTALSACASAAPRYDAKFDAQLLPDSGAAQVSITIDQSKALVTQLALRMPTNRFSDIEVDGDQERQGDTLIWRVPKQGGSLKYRYHVANRRESGAFDARLTSAGGLLRGDDLFPPATVLTNDRARSRSWVRVWGPKHWSVETQYGNTAAQAIRFVHPKRRFDRPTGWMLAGALGIRREEIANRSVAVAAVRGERLRRHDILAFLNWNLPELINATGSFPKRLLIAGADDPFWRGGLSGSQSLYMHSERPLISEDGTSTLLHELVHVASSLRADPGDDWIVEGLAEFYSLEIMRRTGTISQKRFASALDGLRERGLNARSLLTSRSSGDVTALAVWLFRELDVELRQHKSKTGESALSLDAVLQGLIATEEEPVSLATLAAQVEALGVRESKALAKMRKHRRKVGT